MIQKIHSTPDGSWFTGIKDRRLRGKDIEIVIQISPVINYSLACCGMPVVVSLGMRTGGSRAHASSRLEIVIPGLGRAETVLPVGSGGCASQQIINLPPPQFEFEDVHNLENQRESVRRLVKVNLDGEEMEGGPIECRVQAFNECSWVSNLMHRISLAAFVQPNHPLIELLLKSYSRSLFSGKTSREALEAAYNCLAKQWQIEYRFELPSFERLGQKIRLPHQVLVNPYSRRGEGTCVDIALLIAAVLERIEKNPVIAICDMSNEVKLYHALIGCRRDSSRSGLPLIQNKQKLEDVFWVDPQCSTRDPKWRKDFEIACEIARKTFEEKFLYAVDIAAARETYGIEPLPFAGDPQNSFEVKWILESSRKYAPASSSDPDRVSLLLGLLEASGGYIRRLTEKLRGPLGGRLIQRINHLTMNRIPQSNDLDHVMGMAGGIAKEDGSPLVLERHLFLAIMSMKNQEVGLIFQELGVEESRLQSVVEDRTAPWSDKSLTSNFFSYNSAARTAKCVNQEEEDGRAPGEAEKEVVEQVGLSFPGLNSLTIHRDRDPIPGTSFHVGDTIGETWEVRSVLGQGCMSIVYLALDSEKKLIAVKTLKNDRAENPEARRWFEKGVDEWLSLSRRVEHPGILPVKKIQKLGGQIFLSTEYVPPPEDMIESSLRAWMGNRHLLNDERISRWFAQICDALLCAYRQGIRCHGNLKPENVLIDLEENARVTDFGFEFPWSLLTRMEKEERGFPYADPGQLQEKSLADPIVDTHSLGIMLHEMIAGELPSYENE